MYGNNYARQMEAWWKDHGGRHDDPEWLAFLDDYSNLLKLKIDEASAEHDNGGRFGMSKAGGCTRAAVLKLTGAEAEPLSGSTRVTFWLGHSIEVLALATLRALGHDVAPHAPDGKQWTVRIDPFMQSATDAIEGLAPGTARVVSIKSMGYKMSGKTRDGWKRFGFAQYPFDGVRLTNPGYWVQMQAEMHATGMRSGLFVAVAKDIIKSMENDPYLGEKGNGSLSFYTEIVDYDEAFCTGSLIPTWTEAWAAYQGNELPRPMVYTKAGEWITPDPSTPDANKKLTGTYDPCSYCDLREACVTAKLAARDKATTADKFNAATAAIEATA